MPNPTNITVNYASGTGVVVAPTAPEIKDGYVVNWTAQGGAQKITQIEFTDQNGNRSSNQNGPFSSAPAATSTTGTEWSATDGEDDDATYYYRVYVETANGTIVHDPQLLNKKK